MRLFTHMSPSQRQGTLLIFATVSGFSVLPVFVRGVSQNGVPPVDLVVLRFLIAVPALWLLLSLRRASVSDAPLPRLPLLGLGFLLVVAATTAFYGFTYIAPSIYVLIFYSYPAMVAAIAALRGERLGRRDWLALALTLVGVALTTPNLSEGLQQGGNLLGVGLALLNAVVVAVYFLLSGHLLRAHADTARATAWAITGTLLWSIALLFILEPFDGLTLPTTAPAWLSLFGLALVSTVLPNVTLIAGIRKLGPSRAAILSTIEPVLTITLSAIFLGDRLTAVQLCGGALIFVSVIMLQLRRADQPVPVLEPALAQEDISP